MCHTLTQCAALKLMSFQRLCWLVCFNWICLADLLSLGCILTCIYQINLQSHLDKDSDACPTLACPSPVPAWCKLVKWSSFDTWITSTDKRTTWNNLSMLLRKPCTTLGNHYFWLVQVITVVRRLKGKFPTIKKISDQDTPKMKMCQSRNSERNSWLLNLLVSQLMSDGEGQIESIVLC